MAKISKRLAKMTSELEADVKRYLLSGEAKEKTVVCFQEDGGLLAVDREEGRVVMSVDVDELMNFREGSEVLSAKDFRKEYKHNIQDELRNHENCLLMYLSCRQKLSAIEKGEQTKKKGSRTSEADKSGGYDEVSPTVAVN